MFFCLLFIAFYLWRMKDIGEVIGFFYVRDGAFRCKCFFWVVERFIFFFYRVLVLYVSFFILFLLEEDIFFVCIVGVFCVVVLGSVGARLFLFISEFLVFFVI